MLVWTQDIGYRIIVSIQQMRLQQAYMLEMGIKPTIVSSGSVRFGYIWSSVRFGFAWCYSLDSVWFGQSFFV